MTLQAVTIHGSGFKGPGFETGPSSIHVGPTNGPTNVTDIVIVSDAIITCTFPVKDPDWPHRVDLWITNPHGVGHHPDVFEYSPPRPLTIFSIDPPYGLYTGHEPVVIIGQGFLGDELLVPVTNVQFLYFGEITDLTEVEVISDTEIHANTPAGIENREVALRVFSPAAVAYLGITNRDAFKYALPSIFGDVTPNIGSWLGGQTVTMRRLPGQILFHHLVTAFISQDNGHTEYEISFVMIDNDTITYTMPNANTAGFSPRTSNTDPDFTNMGGVTVRFKDAGGIVRMKGYFNYQTMRLLEMTDPVAATALDTVQLFGSALDTITYVEIGDNDSLTFFDVTSTLGVLGSGDSEIMRTVTAPDLTGIVNGYCYIEGLFEDVLGGVETDSIDFTVYSGFEPIITDCTPLHGNYNFDNYATITGVNFAVNTPIACDSCDSSHQTAAYSSYLGSATQSVGQAFTVLDGNAIATADFMLAKVGSPVGNVYAKLYVMDGATTYGTTAVPTPGALATSDPIDVTTLPGSLGIVTFTFSGGSERSLDPDLYYVVAVEYADGDVSNCVSVGYDGASNVHHDGNLSTFDGVTWTAVLHDLIFAVVTQAWVNEFKLVFDGGGGGDVPFAVDSDTQITAHMGTEPLMYADGRRFQLKATSDYGSGSSDVDGGVYWEYRGLPQLIDATPSSGPIVGGTFRTLTVNDTTGCTGADMGGVPMTGFTIVDGTTITAFSPPHALGPVDTHVTNAAGTSSAGAGFTYV